MCGIIGLINKGNKEILTRMTNSLSHRGPDDEGIIWFNELNSGLGHRRLSIIDLSIGGHQPMSNESKSLWITFNGEIFNYKSIREELEKLSINFFTSSDTEVILKAYEQWGVNCLEKFNGMFSFAIFDKINNKVFAARDRLGHKPFYYHFSDNGLIFASEIKAIISSNLLSIEPDPYSILTPTRYQIGPYTGFKNIRKLLPGNYMIFEQGELKISSYWEIKPNEDFIGSEKEIFTQLDYLLNSSVELNMVADVPVGLLLSGGLDSSLIGALAHRHSTNAINSFTIKFSEYDNKFEKAHNDSYYSKLLANQLHFDHHELEITSEIINHLPKLIRDVEEPLTDPASILTYSIAKLARENDIKILLNGIGGDELFGGYRKHLACMYASIYQKLIPSFAQEVIKKMINLMPVASNHEGYRNIRWLKRFISIASDSEYDRFVKSDLSLSPAQYSQIHLTNQDYYITYYYISQLQYFDNKNIHYLTKMCLNDTKVFLPEHNLLYSDKSMMAASVEGRQPLIDHRICEFMFSLPPKYRIRNNIQKWLLKKVAEKYLPNPIIYRPKSSYGVPLRSWIKGDLSSLIKEYLNADSIKKRGVYNYKYIQKLIYEDSTGSADNALIIFQILTNEIWYKTFFI